MIAPCSRAGGSAASKTRSLEALPCVSQDWISDMPFAQFPCVQLLISCMPKSQYSTSLYGYRSPRGPRQLSPLRCHAQPELICSLYKRGPYQMTQDFIGNDSNMFRATLQATIYRFRILVQEASLHDMPSH
jgi:hypothetical protein